MVKKLYRSSSDKMVAGVCGGLGEYFGVDSTLIRILFVALLIFGGGGLLIYIIMWIIVPVKKNIEPQQYESNSEINSQYESKEKSSNYEYVEVETQKSQGKNSTLIGIIIIVVGILILLDNFNLTIGFSNLWPIILIILGIYLILKSKS